MNEIKTIENEANSALRLSQVSFLLFILLFLFIIAAAPPAKAITQDGTSFTIGTAGKEKVVTLWDAINKNYWYLKNSNGVIYSYWSEVQVQSWKTTGGGSWQTETKTTYDSYKLNGNTLIQNYTLDSGGYFNQTFIEQANKIKLLWTVKGGYNRDYRLVWYTNYVPSQVHDSSQNKQFKIGNDMVLDWSDISGYTVTTEYDSFGKIFKVIVEVGNAYIIPKTVDPWIMGGSQGQIITNGQNQTNNTNLAIGQTVNASNITAWTVNITSAKGNMNGCDPYNTSSQCGNFTGLDGWWKADDDWTDSSGNGNTGTNYGAGWSTGKYNNSGAYGIDDYTTLGSSKIVKNTSTISIWFKVNNTPTTEYFMDFSFWNASYAAGNFFEGSISVSAGGNLDVWALSSGTTYPADRNDFYITDSSQNYKNKWHHLTIVFYGNSTGSAYINGVLLGTDSFAYGDWANAPNYTLNLGKKRLYNYNGGSSSFFNGSLDDIRIYDRSLSTEEIRQLYLTGIQHLQVNSNANTTKSGIWNNTGNNPLSIPYNYGESVSSLIFSIPNQITWNNTVIYDYNNASEFKAVSTITTGENGFEISQTHASGAQYYNLSYTPNQDYNWTIININATNYGDTYIGTATLANTTNRVLAGVYPNYTINFTAPKNGTISYHNLTILYNNAPTVSAADQNITEAVNISKTFSASDTEGNALTCTGTLAGQIISSCTSPHSFSYIYPGTYTYYLNVTDNNGTLGGTPTWTNVTAIVNITNSSVPVLLTPADGSIQYYTTVPTVVNFTWSESGASTWDFLLSSDSGFSTIISNQPGLTDNETNVSLITADIYYWKVRKTSGNWSDTFDFNFTETPAGDGFSAIRGVVYESTAGGLILIPSAIVYISNTTWTDSTTTDTNGYYIFNDLVNTSLYSVRATKTGYADSSTELVTTGNGTWITKNLYLEPCVSNYYGSNCGTTQYVKFTVQNIWGTTYNYVAVTVYKSGSSTALYTDSTGTRDDGAVSFRLDKDAPYRLTFINSTLGINQDITLYPIETEYFVVVSYTNEYWYRNDTTSEIGSINITVNTTQNATYGFINVVYTDALSQSSNVRVYINQTNVSDPTNQTVIQTYNGGSVASYSIQHPILTPGSKSYIITVTADHTTFGGISRSFGVHFRGMPTTDIDFIPDWFKSMMALGILFFVAAFGGVTSKSQVAALVCVLGWIFWGFGWFNSLGGQYAVGVPAGLTLATVLAAMHVMKDRAEQEGMV